MTKLDFYLDLLSGFFEEETLNSDWAERFEEAHHVHFSHPEMWKREAGFKDYVSSQIALLVQKDRYLVKKFSELEDRIISMLTYRAVELIKTNADLEALSNGSGL